MSVEEDRAVREGSRITQQEYIALKASVRAEQKRGMLAPFEERQALHEAR